MNNYFIEPIITFFLPTSVAYPRLKVVHQVQLLEQSGKKTMHTFAGPVMTEILKHLNLHLTIITVNQQRPQQMWNTLHKESITNELLARRLGNRAVGTQKQQEHHLPSWVLNFQKLSIGPLSLCHAALEWTLPYVVRSSLRSCVSRQVLTCYYV